MLISYPFPGNIRELKNIIERAIILSDGQLQVSLLPDDISALTRKNDSAESLVNVEREHILKILKAAGGNKTKSAEILGIGLTTLYRKLQSYGLD